MNNARISHDWNDIEESYREADDTLVLQFWILNTLLWPETKRGREKSCLAADIVNVVSF